MIDEIAARQRVTDFDIRRAGHAITGGADTLLTVPSIEMTDGKPFNSDEDRLYVLALLLESCGIDAAVRLGPPEHWRSAIREIHGQK
jgi:hypothetical protein